MAGEGREGNRVLSHASHVLGALVTDCGAQSEIMHLLVPSKLCIAFGSKNTRARCIQARARCQLSSLAELRMPSFESFVRSGGQIEGEIPAGAIAGAGEESVVAAQLLGEPKVTYPARMHHWHAQTPPRRASTASFTTIGKSPSAANESAHGRWKAAFSANPARAIQAR
jgi:hypothetical protein